MITPQKVNSTQFRRIKKRLLLQGLISCGWIFETKISFFIITGCWKNDMPSAIISFWLLIVSWHFVPRWWFPFFCFHPYLGKISNLTNIFQRGLVQPPTRLHMFQPCRAPPWRNHVFLRDHLQGPWYLIEVQVTFQRVKTSQIHPIFEI